LLLGYILNKLGKFESRLFYLCYIPMLSGLFDYLENIGIILMLRSYPEISQGLIQTTSIFSVCKSFMTTIFFVTLIILLLILAVVKRKRQHKGHSISYTSKSE
jgi:membrane-anchored glycerophosphoryl diester phosphodiesterase (GDPDase)